MWKTLNKWVGEALLGTCCWFLVLVYLIFG